MVLRRSWLAAWLILVAIGSAVLVPAPARAVLAEPGGLTPTGTVSQAIPVLTWDRVGGAASYQVQVSENASFESGSLLANVTTVNSRFVPPRTLPVDTTIWWRVMARSGTSSSAWATASFETSRDAGPVPLTPLAGEVLSQPEEPLLLSWTPVPGAVSYAVETDSAPGFPAPKVYPGIATTSYVVQDVGVPTAEAGTGTFWRVKAILDNGVESAWSAVGEYRIEGLETPELVRPAYTAGHPLTNVEDIVLEWEPVAGAVKYHVQVSVDEQFSHFRADDKAVVGTIYAPLASSGTRPWHNDQYFWRVSAIDAFGNESEWSSVWRFERSWEDQPTLQYPEDGSTVGDPFFFQWSAVGHATTYQVKWQKEGSADWTPCAPTVLTTQAGCALDGAGTYHWRVEMTDNSGASAVGVYPGGPIPGVKFLASKTFTYAPGLTEATTPADQPVTGLRVALTGTASQTPGRYCEAGPLERCEDVRSTPVLRWNPVEGATGYRVWVANDRNLTNMYFKGTAPYRDVAQPMYTFRDADARVGEWQTLHENQAEDGFYWTVHACFDGTCPGAVDISQHRVLNKRSNFVELASPLDEATVTSDVVTFEWSDYLATNLSESAVQQTADSVGVHPQQEARQYRFQVAAVPNFQTLLVDHVVDELEYSLPQKLLPEGRLYWRVIPVEQGKPSLISNGENLGRNLSTTGGYVVGRPDVRTFVKATPSPVLDAVNGGQPAQETTPLTWQPAPFAASYNVEVYKNNDTGGDDGRQPQGVNLVATMTSKQVAVVPSTPLPVASTPYRWRVQKVDANGNKGPWSRLDQAAAAFTIDGSAPTQTSPAPDAVVQPNDGFFTWSRSQFAATYRVEVRGSNGSIITTSTTPAVAWAPISALAPGSHEWRVVAVDKKKRDIAASPWRSITVPAPDTTAPTVVAFRPAASATVRRGTTFRATFNEPVVGASRATVRLVYLGRAVRARVTMSRDRRTVTLNPAKRLRGRTPYTFALSSGITDRSGNALRDTSVTVTTTRR